MKKFSFLLIFLLWGTSMIANAQLSFIANGQTITSSNSWDICLVDLNGDTISDAVFESKVWHNDGKGIFTKSDMYIGSGLYPAFADLNGDKFVDVLNQDSIFINDGTFHFSFSKKLVSDIAMYSSVLADIDKDGDIDIISSSTLTDRILLNDGTGNFTNTNKSLGGWGQAKYAIGDLNDDGFTDIYVAIPHIPPMGSHTPNLIWQGDGEGNFTQKTHDIAGAESRAVILADFDGDRDLDLYVSDATKWGRVFNNDGNGNFTDSGQKLGSRTGDAKTSDFNNDGNLDLFICQGDGNGVTGNGAPSIVWLGDGKGHFTDSKVRLQIGNTNSIAVGLGDINYDGKTDAMVANVKLDEQNGYVPLSCPVEIWLNNTFICNYFDQTPPGDTAIKFAPGIFSLTDRNEGNIAFSPDGSECYFSVSEPDNTEKIYYTKWSNNTWTAQEVVPFSVNQNFGGPVFSLDGNKLFFYDHNAQNSMDIWRVERIVGGWGDSQILPSPINSNSLDFGYAETTDSTIYFNSNRPGSLNQSIDIWCKRPSSDQAENLGITVNSGNNEICVCVAPDGSYLIFSSDRWGGVGVQDLYICFNKGNNEWTDPINMERGGTNINITGQHQNSPTLSPDGKYLFFGRHTPQNEVFKYDPYWVSTSIIDTLKTIAFTTSVETLESKHKVSIKPNPTASLITISLDQFYNQKSVIEILDIQGKTIIKRTIETNPSTLDLTNYPEGLYLVKVNTGTESFIKKIIKN